MKKIINKLFAGSLLAGMMLVSSCAGDYLDTAPTDSTGATDAVGTTANAMKALNGIAKIMTTQHSYFGSGFAGENNIMIQYESYPSENYNYLCIRMVSYLQSRVPYAYQLHIRCLRMVLLLYHCR